ncbi:MAG: PEP-utilizing enzyme [Chloroflexi bacterium]|nr:PEP-utilizing enzyme [Chloroflexota bacterium]
MTDELNHSWIFPLDSGQANLALAGGKGANLARLVRAGFPVPGGFIINTQAYRTYAEANGLEKRILAALPHELPENPGSLLEEISSDIREWFASGQMPLPLAAELRSAYAELANAPVAVRSSATAEDLPGMSFAGQQDTYLNVVGESSLLEAVVNCWSSLWTARAIGYRFRNEVPHAEAALAVVVQRMVQSRASGVLFTANPLTGLRSETVIDATLGLGEALVSGQVEPDHYVVDPQAGQIVSRALGAKARMIQGLAGGGTTVTEQNVQAIQALPDAQILMLSRLGQQAAALFASPQDIEWAWDGETLFLLQSRPITSLYPLPEGMPPAPLKVLLSFAAVQGILDPLTPLGRDMICEIFATAAGIFGYHVNFATQTALFTAGERLWGNLTSPFSNSFGRKVVLAGLKWGEPTVRQALLSLVDESGLQPEKTGIRPRTRLKLARFFLPIVANMLLNMGFPATRRRMIIGRGELLLVRRKEHLKSFSGSRQARLNAIANIPEFYRQQLPKMVILYISSVASGMASYNLLDILAKQLPEGPSGGWHDLVLDITRGLPGNPTTEMDLALWQIAQTIGRDPASREAFDHQTSAGLAKAYQEGRLPTVIMQAMSQFLEKYGLRGLGEIDTGRPRWNEDPTHIFSVVGNYLKIEHVGQSPDMVFTHSTERAAKAVEQLAAAARKSKHGWIKTRIVYFLARRARIWLSTREHPKFFLVRMMGLTRQELLEVGREYVESGELEQADDLFYLHLPELAEFASGSSQDWRSLIARRRQAYNRELLRRQIPRLLLSDGRAFYEGMRADGNAGQSFSGSPVSPGSIEGYVRVVLDPRQAQLLPGEILVCPGTDPSWTPLFLSASGLIMEVGGMMTHGAVVAREYGIPAIVGVDRATLRLKTGQRVRLDGSSGLITLLQ